LLGGATVTARWPTIWTVPSWTVDAAPANLMHGFSEHEPDATAQL
jgi:hypothetical protein